MRPPPIRTGIPHIHTQARTWVHVQAHVVDGRQLGEGHGVHTWVRTQTWEGGKRGGGRKEALGTERVGAEDARERMSSSAPAQGCHLTVGAVAGRVGTLQEAFAEEALVPDGQQLLGGHRLDVLAGGVDPLGDLPGCGEGSPQQIVRGKKGGPHKEGMSDREDYQPVPDPVPHCTALGAPPPAADEPSEESSALRAQVHGLRERIQALAASEVQLGGASPPTPASTHPRAPQRTQACSCWRRGSCQSQHTVARSSAPRPRERGASGERMSTGGAGSWEGRGTAHPCHGPWSKNGQDTHSMWLKGTCLPAAACRLPHSP